MGSLKRAAASGHGCGREGSRQDRAEGSRGRVSKLCALRESLR